MMGGMNPADETLVAAINDRTGAGLALRGRAEHGKLGGAIYVEWPDGRAAIVTRFLGSLDDAERTAEVLAYVRDRGVPVPRHHLVVALDDGVAFVQERLPRIPSRLTAARVDGLVAINDRCAGVLAPRPDVPAPAMCRQRSDDPAGHPRLAELGRPHRRVLEELSCIRRRAPAEIAAGTDLVHIDLSPANVLFDETDRATAVVDWNLGVYRGDRMFALVNTRFDREWFVRSPDADPVESRAAAHLDEILAERIDPGRLRSYWALWLLHHLSRTLDSGPLEALEWQLDMAQSRLL